MPDIATDLIPFMQHVIARNPAKRKYRIKNYSGVACRNTPSPISYKGNCVLNWLRSIAASGSGQANSLPFFPDMLNGRTSTG